MFAIVGAVVSVWSLAAPSARFNCDNFPRLRRASTATLVAIGLLSLWAAGCVVTDRFYVADGTSRRTGFSMSTLTFPRGVADFMLEVPVRGHFFNGFASGSYLAYRLYPEYKVFIAGNTFKYPPEFFEDYTLVSMGGNEYKLLAEEYGLTAFTMMYNSADMMPLAKRLFNDDDYTAVYFDDNAVLYVRNIPEMESIIEAHRVDFAAIARQRAAETPTPTNRAIPLVPTARRIYPRGEVNRATFLFQVGLYQMAEIEYDRALKIDPTLEDVRHGLGDVILAQGRYEEAREILEPLAAGDPGSPHLHADLAKALSGIGSAAAAARQWDEARRNLELALERIERSRRLDPDGDPQRPLEAADRFNLGFVLLQLAQQTGDATLEAEADRQFVATLEAQPEDDTLRYRVARVRVVQGRLEEAIDLLAEALAGGDPSLREQARYDRAWAPAYQDPRFRELVLQPADRP